MNKQQGVVVVLEPSTNTHTMRNESGIEVQDFGNGILKIKTAGKSLVEHGEHGIIATEANDVLKYVQQEVNPVTRAIQNAYD